MKRLGERIKKRREVLQMHLNDVARIAGISAGALSQIENAKAFPSILTLKAISGALNSTVGELIGDSDSMDKNPLIKYSERKFVNKNATGTSLYLLSHHETGKLMDTFLLVMAQDSDSTGFFKAHSGQELCHVLKGEVDFELEDSSYNLKTGDSIYYNSSRFHHVSNKNFEEAELLWVVTPANI